MKYSHKFEKIQAEWKDMAIFLSEELPEGRIRDELYDQLFWLKKQIDRYHENPDIQTLSSNFNEVVDKFNNNVKKKTFKKQ